MEVLQRRSAAGTILLVEDERPIRDLMRRALAASGYRVLEASDGLEALDQFEKHGAGIDLLVTDLLMPRLTGQRLIRALRQRRRTLKVLCITGYPVNTAAFDEPTLMKPFTRTELLDAIRNVLSGISAFWLMAVELPSALLT